MPDEFRSALAPEDPPLDQCRLCGGQGNVFNNTCSRCAGCGLDPGYGIDEHDEDYDAEAFAATYGESD